MTYSISLKTTDVNFSFYIILSLYGYIFLAFFLHCSTHFYTSLILSLMMWNRKQHQMLTDNLFQCLLPIREVFVSRALKSSIPLLCWTISVDIAQWDLAWHLEPNRPTQTPIHPSSPDKTAQQRGAAKRWDSIDNAQGRDHRNTWPFDKTCCTTGEHHLPCSHILQSWPLKFTGDVMAAVSYSYILLRNVQ